MRALAQWKLSAAVLGICDRSHTWYAVSDESIDDYECLCDSVAFVGTCGQNVLPIAHVHELTSVYCCLYPRKSRSLAHERYMPIRCAADIRSIACKRCIINTVYKRMP
jgi:hypothetical protein